MNRNRKTLAVLVSLLAAGSSPVVSSQPLPQPQGQQQSANPNPNPNPNASPTPNVTQPQMPPPAPVTPGGIKGNLKGIDALLVQLSSVTTDMNRFITGGLAAFKGDGLEGSGALSAAGYQEKLREDCAAHFSLSDMALRPIPGGSENALVSYQMCVGFTTHRDACAVLSQYQRESPAKGDLVRKCQAELVKMKRIYSVRVHSPGALASCKEALGMAIPPIISEANRDKACAILTSTTDAGEICSQMSPLRIRPYNAAGMKECVREMRAEFGDAKVCGDYAANSDDHWQRDLCLGQAAYLRARAAHNPNLCGSLEICHMMMGDADACGLSEADLKEAYCSSSAAEKYVAAAPMLEARQKDVKARPHPSRETQYMELFKQKRAYAEALMAQLSSAIDSYEPKSSAAYKVRKDKFHARRAVLQNEMKAFHAPSGGKKRAGGKTDTDAP